MKSFITVILVLVQVNFLVAQTPTAAEYHSTSISSDGTTLYGYSSLEGSMSGNFPHNIIRHTYTTGFKLVAPDGSGIPPATCSNSQSGDPNSSFDPSCSADISLIGNGIYAMNLAESAICSYAGTFFSNSGSSVYVYPPSFINKLWGGLLSYGSIDSATGNLQNVQLTPEAYEYLKASGFIDAATLGTATAVLIEVPGLGEVVFAIAVVYITYRAVQALQTWVESRGNHDPPLVQAMDRSPQKGRMDVNGKCINGFPPPSYKWQAVDKVAWNGQLHWHWYGWNLNDNPDVCTWFSTGRQEGLNDPGPGYIYLGIWQWQATN